MNSFSSQYVFRKRLQDLNSTEERGKISDNMEEHIEIHEEGESPSEICLSPLSVNRNSDGRLRFDDRSENIKADI